MTKSRQDLVNTIVKNVGISKGKASLAVDVIYDVMGERLEDSPSIGVGGYGAIERKARGRRRKKGGVALPGSELIVKSTRG